MYSGSDQDNALVQQRENLFSGDDTFETASTTADETGQYIIEPISPENDSPSLVVFITSKDSNGLTGSEIRCSFYDKSNTLHDCETFDTSITSNGNYFETDCSAGLGDGTTIGDYKVTQFIFDGGDGTQKVSIASVVFLQDTVA